MRTLRLRGMPGAWSRIDALVIVTIGVVLVGLVIPMLGSWQDCRNRLSCSDNLRQIGVAMLSYESANGTFPPGLFPARVAAPGPINSPDPNNLQYGYHSGFAALLPYMQQASMPRMNLQQPWFAGGATGNAGLVPWMLRVFLCPGNRARDVIDLSSLSHALMKDGSLAEALPDLGSVDYLL